MSLLAVVGVCVIAGACSAMAYLWIAHSFTSEPKPKREALTVTDPLDPHPFVSAVATPLPDADLCAHCKLAFAAGSVPHWTLGGGPYHAGCAFHVAGAPRGAA